MWLWSSRSEFATARVTVSVDIRLLNFNHIIFFGIDYNILLLFIINLF